MGGELYSTPAKVSVLTTTIGHNDKTRFAITTPRKISVAISLFYIIIPVLSGKLSTTSHLTVK